MQSNDTILIIGDSWAATWIGSSGDVMNEYAGALPHRRSSVYGPNRDGNHRLTIDQCLLQKGYEVINKSWFGCSNIDTICAGIQYMRYRAPQLPKIKLVIFFNTELSRNWRWLQLDGLQESIETNEAQPLKAGHLTHWLNRLHTIQAQVLTHLRELTPDAQWAIIGGQAPLYKPEEYQWADYIKEDWRSELVGYTLPYSHTMSTQEIVSNIFDLETREIELNKYEVIRKALEKSDRFNDGVHPNHQCHQALAEELIAHFNL